MEQKWNYSSWRYRRVLKKNLLTVSAGHASGERLWHHGYRRFVCFSTRPIGAVHITLETQEILP